MEKKLGRLISGQDLAFDTHQAGDGQEMNWKKVHMEKRMHGRTGKARFPLIGNESPSKSNSMTGSVFNEIKNEVRSVLKKNEDLVERLAQTIANELHRFSEGRATEVDAKIAARKIASYFDLNENFETILVNYMKNNISTISTVHRKQNGESYEIIQSKKDIEVRKARKYITRPKINYKN